MGAQILSIHWKATKWLLLPFIVAAFGLPLAASRVAWGIGGGADWMAAGQILTLASGYASFFPMLAAVVGSMVALTAWNWDHQTGHVYALSLPISRPRYAALKFAAGLAILALPTVSMLVGGLVATGLMELPLGLQAYPVDLALRFFLASLLAYGLIFSMAAGRMRTALYVVGGFVALFVFGAGTIEFFQMSVPALQGVDVLGGVEQIIAGDRGVFSIFAGNWSLIDV